MPAIQEVVSAMVCGHEQAASTTNGAARVHRASTIAGTARSYRRWRAFRWERGERAQLMAQNSPKTPDFSVGAGHAREHAESAGCFGGGGHACEQTGNV